MRIINLMKFMDDLFKAEKSFTNKFTLNVTTLLNHTTCIKQQLRNKSSAICEMFVFSNLSNRWQFNQVDGFQHAFFNSSEDKIYST